MSEPFIGEIRIVGFNFAPRSWAFCDGQLLPISQNTALFSILGTTYGGDGRSTFGLPNLQGRVAMGAGRGPGLTDRFLGGIGGQQTVTLTTQEIPQHNHNMSATAAPATLNTPSPTATLTRVAATNPIYAPSPPVTSAPMSTAALATAGGGQPHNNMMPYQTLNYIIALQGLFPSRN